MSNFKRFKFSTISYGNLILNSYIGLGTEIFLLGKKIYYIILKRMLNFFYTSLETLKQVKKPTKKDIITISIQIFVVIIVAGAFFAITDGVFASLYQRFYNIMK